MLNEVQNLTTDKDIVNQELLVRCNNHACLEKVRDAYNLIYNHNYAVGTPQVEALLKPESLVPTLV
jgi:hypothetical protein